MADSSSKKPNPTPTTSVDNRKKIRIAPITDPRSRQVTFLKRKNGLLKKAMELGVLCDCEVTVIIYNVNNGKLFEYSSVPIENALQRYATYSGPYERKKTGTCSNNPASKFNANIPLNEPHLAQAALDAANAATRRPRPFQKFDPQTQTNTQENGKRLSHGETPPPTTGEKPLFKETAHLDALQAEKAVKLDAKDSPHSNPCLFKEPPLHAVQPPTSFQLPPPQNSPCIGNFPSSVTPRFTPSVPFQPSLKLPSSVSPKTLTPPQNLSTPPQLGSLSALVSGPATLFPRQNGPLGQANSPFSNDKLDLRGTFKNSVQETKEKSYVSRRQRVISEPSHTFSNLPTSKSKLGNLSSIIRQEPAEEAFLPPPWTTNDEEAPPSTILACQTESSYGLVAGLNSLGQATSTNGIYVSPKKPYSPSQPPQIVSLPSIEEVKKEVNEENDLGTNPRVFQTKKGRGFLNAAEFQTDIPMLASSKMESFVVSSCAEDNTATPLQTPLSQQLNNNGGNVNLSANSFPAVDSWVNKIFPLVQADGIDGLYEQGAFEGKMNDLEDEKEREIKFHADIVPFMSPNILSQNGSNESGAVSASLFSHPLPFQFPNQPLTPRGLSAKNSQV